MIQSSRSARAPVDRRSRGACCDSSRGLASTCRLRRSVGLCRQRLPASHSCSASLAVARSASRWRVLKHVLRGFPVSPLVARRAPGARSAKRRGLAQSSRWRGRAARRGEASKRDAMRGLVMSRGERAPLCTFGKQQRKMWHVHTPADVPSGFRQAIASAFVRNCPPRTLSAEDW